MRGLTVGSLFAGVGGIELGLHDAGHGPVQWQVEANETRRRILEKHWPGVRRYERVADVRGEQLPRAQLITAGFPCKSTSVAGKGAGLAGPGSREWRHAARIIGEHRSLGKGAAEWVLIENVAGAAKRWVDAVRGDLGRLGYATFPFELQARYVGLPHGRARIFIVAHAERNPLRLWQQRLPGGRTDGVRDEAQAELVDAGEAGRWASMPPLHRSHDGAAAGLDAARIAGCGVAAVP